jgi:hypothetical protein
MTYQWQRPEHAAPPRSIFAKRHYAWIAAYWKHMRGVMTDDEWEHAVMLMTAMFKHENHNFITTRFLQACGMTRGEANRMLEGE